MTPMAGIAGIAGPGNLSVVERMLAKIAHRGRGGREIKEINGITLGAILTSGTAPSMLMQTKMVQDGPRAGHGASARLLNDKLVLERDAIGVVPLYYGYAEDGALCFASEVKALLETTFDVNEFPPGYRYDGISMERCFGLRRQPPISDSAEHIAGHLRRLLQASVSKRISQEEYGAWLSGGLDSSAIVALVRPHVKLLHTFAAGLPGAQDLEHARYMAEFIKSDHHEIIVSMDDMLRALPKVIYHLESFDALLVRSSIINYLAAGAVSDYVGEVFSGEGGDELFAGYDYLKTIAGSALNAELIDITERLHNTALQRVDRCASAHGLTAHVCFLDPDVVDYAFQISSELKIRNDVEKWILREALRGLLPEIIITRKKVKFWEGAGVEQLLSEYADKHISDGDFHRERTLPNDWMLNSKEELMYYRIFREHFGQVKNLSWMGRTKNPPLGIKDNH